MQVVMCVMPFGLYGLGDLAEVPDGNAVDPHHWRPLTAEEIASLEQEPEPDAAPETPPEPTEAPAPEVLPVTPTEM